MAHTALPMVFHIYLVALNGKLITAGVVIFAVYALANCTHASYNPHYCKYLEQRSVRASFPSQYPHPHPSRYGWCDAILNYRSTSCPVHIRIYILSNENDFILCVITLDDAGGCK